MRAKPLPLKQALALAFGLAALDQLSKIAIVFGPVCHHERAIFAVSRFHPDLELRHQLWPVCRGGAAGAFLIGIALAAIGFFTYLMRGAAFSPVCCLCVDFGGALGNLIDRLWHGAVVDFISLHAAGYYWYVFNMADIWITGAVIILIYDAFRAE